MSAAVGTAPARSTFRTALANRDYRWLVTGFTISIVGSWAYNVALAVYIFDATGSVEWVAAASLGRFVPVLLLSPYGGVLAERFERTRVMKVADILSTVWMAGLAVLAQADGPIIAAVVLAALTSVMATVFMPAQAALTPQIVGEHDLASANALNSAIENASVVVGPALGAGLLALGPPELAFAINAATYLVSVFCLTRVRTRSQPTDVAAGGVGMWEQTMVGFRALRQSSLAALLVAFSVLATFFYGVDTVLFIALSDQQLGTGPNGYGYLLAGLGVGGVLGSLFINRIAASPRLGTIIAVGMVTYCLPTAAMVFIEEPAVAFVAQVVRGAGTLVVDVLAITALQRSLPADLIARVFGVFMALAVGALAVGAFLTPITLNLLGLDGTLLLFGLAVPALVVLAYPRLLGVDRALAARLAELEPRIALLAQLGLLAEANRSALENLASGLTEIDVPADEVVVTEGDDADAFYVIVEGAARVTTGSDGAVAELAMLGDGDYFGEIGLLQHIPRTATVTTTRPSHLLRIDGDAFEDAFAHGASAMFMENAARRLGAARSTATTPDAEPAVVT